MSWGPRSREERVSTITVRYNCFTLQDYGSAELFGTKWRHFQMISSKCIKVALRSIPVMLSEKHHVLDNLFDLDESIVQKQCKSCRNVIAFDSQTKLLAYEKRLPKN